MKLTRLLLLSLGLFVIIPAFSKTIYRNIVIFGDSLSDNGNLYAMTYHQQGGPIPNPKNWFNGRFSNGLVWDEYLASMLNLPTSSLINFAYGGAESGFGNAENVNAPKGVKYPGLLNEVSLFLKSSINKNLNNKQTLYIIWIGANNYLASDSKHIKSQIRQVSVDTAEAIGLLANRANAQHFMVINMPDLGKTPRSRMAAQQNPKVPVELSALTHANNQALEKTLNEIKQKLRVNITYVDINKVLLAMLSNPKQYGFSNTTQACFNVKTGKICDNPNEYLFWGTIHPTTKTHKILAAFIYRYIK